MALPVRSLPDVEPSARLHAKRLHPAGTLRRRALEMRWLPNGNGRLSCTWVVPPADPLPEPVDIPPSTCVTRQVLALV